MKYSSICSHFSNFRITNPQISGSNVAGENPFVEGAGNPFFDVDNMIKLGNGSSTSIKEKQMTGNIWDLICFHLSLSTSILNGSYQYSLIFAETRLPR